MSDSIISGFRDAIPGLQHALTVLAIACLVIWLIVHRGRHTRGARWFGLAAFCLAGVLALSLAASWHMLTFAIFAVFVGIGVLALYVPEKASPYAKEHRTPWRFWRQAEWERSYTTPARSYPNGKPLLPWAIRHQRARARGQTLPPHPWQENRS